MALTPAQVQQYRTQYGLDKGSVLPSQKATKVSGLPVSANASAGDNDLSSKLEERIQGFKAAATPVQPKVILPPKSTTNTKEGFMNSDGVKIAKALVSSEQGLAKDIAAAFGKPHISGTDLKTAVDSSSALIAQAKKFPQGDPRRRDLLAKAAALDKQTGDMASGNAANIPSNEKALGDVGGVALDVLSAGSYSGVGAEAKSVVTGLKTGKAFELAGETGKLVTKAPAVVTAVTKAGEKAVGASKGFVQGFKSGVKVGAPISGAYGITHGMQEDKSLKGVLVEGLESAAVGGVTAGVVSGVAGAIKGKANALPMEQKKTALEAIVPKPKELTPTEYAEMVRQGRVTPKTALGGTKIIPSKTEIDLADKYTHVLQSKDPVKNMDSVMSSIQKEDAIVGDYLRSKPIIYNTGELRNSLQKGVEGITDIMVPDQRNVQKLKDSIINGLIESLDKNNLEDLWIKRKAFDQMIDSQINAFGGSPTLKKEISRGVRDAAQDFITSKLGNDKYSTSMKVMRDMFRISDLLETKAVKEKGASMLQLWIKANPGKAAALKWIIPSVAGGAVGSELLLH